jgi:O-antigen ligase
MEFVTLLFLLWSSFHLLPFGNSVVPQKTASAVGLYALAAAVFWMGRGFFSNPQSRQWLLLGISFNAGMLAVWGIIQRSAGLHEVIPFQSEITHPAPFTTFYSRNCGAAAIIAGLSASVGLFAGRHFKPLVKSQRRRTGVKSTSEGYRQSSSWNEVGMLLNVSLILLTAIGVVLSLSRGAWIGSVFSLVVVFGLLARRLPTRSAVLIVMGGLLAIGASVALLAQEKRVLARSEQLQFQQISLDARWHHFGEAWDTALAYLPFGSGAGTYGYVHLPYLKQDRDSWFMHAHNQYLETVVELGLPGIVLVLVGVGVLASCSLRLLRNPQDEDQMTWGVAGTISLVAMVIQNSVDFTIIVPANLLTYALFFGGLSGCDSDARQSRRYQKRNDSKLVGWFPERTKTYPILAVVFLSLLVAVKFLGEEFRAGSTLSITKLADLTRPPSRELCDRNIERLTAAIADAPQHAGLWQRRAWWHLARYRLGLLEHFKAMGQPEAWLLTSETALFTAIMGIHPDDRPATREKLLLPEGSQLILEQVSADLQNAIDQNPLIPQIHLFHAQLSPLMDKPFDVALDHATKISRTNCDHLFAIGVLRFYSGKSNEALELWQRCLMTGYRHWEKIVELASRDLQPSELIEQLFPSDPQRLFTYLPRFAQHKPTQGWIGHLCERIESVLSDYPSIEPSQRLQLLAQTKEYSGDWSGAAEHWQAAVGVTPRDGNLRIRYATSLLKTGEVSRARDQVLVARQLRPSRQQLDRIVQQVEATEKQQP